MWIKMNRFINKYFFYYPAIFLKTKSFHQCFNQLKESQWYSYELLQKIQLQRLIKLLEFAKENIPYYSEVLQKIEPKSFSAMDDIQQVPILTKELLKENFKSMLNANLMGAMKKTTGGSTGNPVTVYKSAKAMGATYAAEWRGYQWAGVGIGDRQGRFWGIPNDKNQKNRAKWIDRIANRERYSAFSFDKADLENYYYKLNQFKPKYFYGYVSMLEAFANYLLEHDLRLEFQPFCVITTSEVLTQVHRRLFEKAFKCRVYNEYGCGEIGTIAHECGHGSMHTSAENILLEIHQNGGTPQPGETGDIVVTDLNNTAMPLIRYNLKDLGYLEIGSCECGRGLPVLTGLHGRAYDIIYNKAGKAFHGEYFMYIFEELQNRELYVSSLQAVQEDFDNFTLKLVTDTPQRTKMEEYIINRVHETYGTYANIKFEYVSNIEREKSGKLRLIKSLITNQNH